MMACSYLSAGGKKNDSSSAACWSPPAMTGVASDTRLPLPSPLMTLPSGPMPLPSGSMALPSRPMAPPSAQAIQTELANLPNPIGLPRAPMALPRAVMPQKTGQSEIPTRSMGLPCAMGPMGLPSRPTLPSGTGLPSGSNAQIGLPPPFTRALPIELCGLPQSGSSSEPALDLSTSASSIPSSVPSSLKRRLPSSEDTE